MCLGVGAVCDVGVGICVLRQFLQHAVEHPAPIPAREARVDRLERAEPRRKVSPRRTRLRDVEDCIQELPLRNHRRPPPPPLLWGEQRLDAGPFGVAQLMAVQHPMHRSAEIAKGNFSAALADSEFADST